MVTVKLTVLLLAMWKNSVCDPYVTTSLTNGKLIIHHNELPIAMQDHAIVTTIRAFDDLTDYNAIAKNISDTFNDEYGGVWNCLVDSVAGNTTIFGFQLSRKDGSYVSFSIGPIRVTLFELRTAPYVPSDLEVITRAKNFTDSVRINADTNLGDSFRDKAVQIIAETILGNLTTYQDIATSAQKQLTDRLGDNWFVIVGRERVLGFSYPHTSDGLLNATFGGLNVLAYRSLCFECVEHKLTVKEVIGRARLVNGVVYQGRFLAHNYDEGSGMANEAMVYIDNAVQTQNSYHEIAYDIANNLKIATEYNTLPDNWFVFVSDSSSGVQYSPAGYAFVRLRYGPLEIAILKTAY